MWRSLATSAGLHILGVVALLWSSLLGEPPPDVCYWPLPSGRPVRMCFYPIVDARLLLKGASRSDVEAFLGKKIRVGHGESGTLCLAFREGRKLELAFLEGRVTDATWLAPGFSCAGRTVAIPRKGIGAGYVGLCPGEFQPLIM